MVSRPMHIYASVFSRRDRSRRLWRRRLTTATPTLLGALTGAVVIGLAEFAPEVFAKVL